MNVPFWLGSTSIENDRNHCLRLANINNEETFLIRSQKPSNVNVNAEARGDYFPLVMASNLNKALDVFSDACCSGEFRIDDHNDDLNYIYDNDDEGEDENNDDIAKTNLKNSRNSYDDKGIVRKTSVTPLAPVSVGSNILQRETVDYGCEGCTRKGCESPTSSANTEVFDEERGAAFHLSLCEAQQQSGGQGELERDVPASVIATTNCSSSSLSSLIQSKSLLLPPPVMSRKRPRLPEKNSKRKVTTNKSALRFCDAPNLCSIHYTISRWDMTDQEIRNTWLQSDEFLKILRRDERVALRIEQQTAPHHLKHICTRGLESRLQLQALRKQSHRLIGLEEVLVELENQWDRHDYNVHNTNTKTNNDGDSSNDHHCRYDFDAFAKVYGNISKICKIQAEKVAQNDRKEVEDYLKEEPELEVMKKQQQKREARKTFSNNTNTNTNKNQKQKTVTRSFSSNYVRSPSRPEAKDMCWL